MRNRVLVTGASGVVGKAVVSDLTENGWDVVAVSSADADLRDLEATDALFDRVEPSHVIHLAARVYGLLGNLAHPAEVFLDNIRLNTNTIDSAHRHGVERFVAMGSVAMYADGLQLPVREEDLLSGEPHHSEAAYASAKRAMLAQLEAYRLQYSFEYTFAVATNMFGPGDRFDEVEGHVLPSLISKFHRGATSGEPVEIWGTGVARRDFLSSRDAAAGLRLLLTAPPGAYNLATGVETEVKEVVETLVEVTGFRGELAWDHTKPDGQRRRLYDITKLTALGWAPRQSLRDALAEAYGWYSAHADVARR